MLHMFGHGRQKENIILVPYVHSFFVCALIHVLHGRLYYVSILGDTFVDKQLVPVFSGCVAWLFVYSDTTPRFAMHIFPFCIIDCLCVVFCLSTLYLGGMY